MAWTTPRIWISGEMVTATGMNTFVSENLAYLMDGPSGAVNYSNTYCITSSTGYVTIESTLPVTITVARPRVLVYYWCGYIKSNAGGLYLTVSNGTSNLGNVWTIAAGGSGAVSLMGLFTDLTVGTSYTFTPQWKQIAAGTSNTNGAGSAWMTFAAMEI